jgi:hypothetical protein
VFIDCPRLLRPIILVVFLTDLNLFLNCTILNTRGMTHLKYNCVFKAKLDICVNERHKV